MSEICSETEVVAPSVMETSPIKEATPMIIPSMVRKVRILLAPIADQAILHD